MDLTRNQKILLGILTVWPVLYIGIFILSIAGMVVSSCVRTCSPMGIASIGWIFPLHFLTIFLTLGLVVFYVVYIVKSEAIPDDNKVIWILIVIFGSIPGMTAFWFVHFWKDVRNTSGGGPG